MQGAGQGGERGTGGATTTSGLALQEAPQVGRQGWSRGDWRLEDDLIIFLGTSEINQQDLVLQ